MRGVRASGIQSDSTESKEKKTIPSAKETEKTPAHTILDSQDILTTIYQTEHIALFLGNWNVKVAAERDVVNLQRIYRITELINCE